MSDVWSSDVLKATTVEELAEAAAVGQYESLAERQTTAALNARLVLAMERSTVEAAQVVSVTADVAKATWAMAEKTRSLLWWTRFLAVASALSSIAALIVVIAS
jgi:hypothetical protein